MDHEQDRSDLAKKQNTRSSKAGDGENDSSAIELDRFDRSSIAERRMQVEDEADLATGGAAGAPALAAEVEAPRRTTAMKDKEIFSSKIVWICAFFLLLYVVSSCKCLLASFLDRLLTACAL